MLKNATSATVKNQPRHTGQVLMILIMVAVYLYACHTSANNIKGQVQGNASMANDLLENGFQHPPDSVKPWIYWYWINNNISEEGIKKDLEAMARVGIGEALIGNIGQDSGTIGKIPLFSKEWYRLTGYAVKEAKQLGMSVGFFNGPGWSQSGGPWIAPKQAMRALTATETIVKGPSVYAQELPFPGNDFQEVALLAYPLPEASDSTIASVFPHITIYPQQDNGNLMADGSTDTELIFKENTSDSVIINIELSKPFTARSLVLYPAKKPFIADVELQMKTGSTYRTLKKFVLDRRDNRKFLGYMTYGPVAVALPSSIADNYRLILSRFKDVNGQKTSGGLAEIGLSGSVKLEYYVEKQLGKMHQTALPPWSEYQWVNQREPEDKRLIVDSLKHVIDISKYLSSSRSLNWHVPPGTWKIVHIGMMPTGVTNHPATPPGRGLEVDKMNKSYVAYHFNAFIGDLLKHIAPEDLSAFKHVVIDSYEVGSQNWTDGLAKDFIKRYGYDPVPWLPVLTGDIIESADHSNRFLWDLRRLIADRIAYDYIGGFRQLSEERHLRLWMQNYGHWGFPAEFLQYGGQSNDISGEFWAEGSNTRPEVRAAASAAHIYGKNTVFAESFTASAKEFQRYPGYLKKVGDWSFTEGVNHTLLHVYIQQPDEKKPGINAWFGTEFNRHNTWFEMSKGWIDYLRRCMFMLQRGRVVRDVAYFIGEDVPKMTGIRDPELPSGYSYDYINSEVIERDLKVENGRFVLPGGISYELLVLPPQTTMRPELLRKIRSLVAEGGTILGPPPVSSPSLQHYPFADQEITQLAKELWNKVDGKVIHSASFGKGRVFMGMTLQSALNELGLQPDLNLQKEVPVLFIHRTMPGADIYFLTNQGKEIVDFSPEFRIAGKQPEWWDPVTGDIRPLPSFVLNKSGTKVQLRLDAFQSGFIIFRKAAALPDTERINFPIPHTVKELDAPWNVTFMDTMQHIKPVIFNSLIDWTKAADEHIRHYSGTAIYKTVFDIRKINGKEQLFLDLGNVNVMAKVKINGKEAGTVWTAPWRVKVTGLVKRGENDLEIEVVNTWANRLIGDSGLPPDKKKTSVTFNFYKPGDQLFPSGLSGPVTIQSVIY